MTSGWFITFEGGEGAGKTTQVRLLAERLMRAGFDVVQTREPGGSPGAELIRSLLVTGEADRWSAMTETLMMYAARRDHIERLIRPALGRGAIVLCDRFADSTRAYQGGAGGAPHALVSALEAFVLEDTHPSRTFILDLPAEVGLSRAEARAGDEARFEAKGLAFHERLRQAFLEIATGEPERCRVIDASQNIDAIHEQIWSSVAADLGLDG